METADGASGLCFLHDTELTPAEREEMAKRAKGYASLKTYVENKAKHKESLRGVHLAGAELWDADLRDAKLSGAHLEGAILSDVHLEDAELSDAHLEGAELSDAHLDGAILSSAHLESSFLERAHLERATLSRAHLEGAELEGAHLEGAELEGAHLEGTDLTEAHLEGAELYNAHLEGADLSGTDLAETRGLSVEHLKQIAPSVEAFRCFKRAFLEMSRYDDASQAAFLEKRQCTRDLLRQGQSWRWSDFPTFSWLGNQALRYLCGYFEKPWRPLLWSAGFVLLFALVYSCGDAFTPYPISGNDGAYEAEVELPARDAAVGAPAKDKQKIGMSDAVYCSLVTFTTLGYGDFRPRAGWWRLVAAGEAAIGAFMIALFVVTLSHRFVAR
ncbi:MAG: pentapeptide repeat-containing protein [Lentisphaerae bacterium]|nr:pentapeptide repeat-containing protein [Lentisphaerota bacterium]